jgi:SAM-dependent methyltransferase
MVSDPTRRFSSRVEDYVRYRPSYPEALIPFLEQQCGLTAETRIADIGSGTGLLAALFLRFGCEVLGVEPNADMRLAGERLLAAQARFHSGAGRAEATGLPAESVDMIAAGQAFHWFDRPAARLEFARILKPGGWVVLVWNERLVNDYFRDHYERLLIRYSPDYTQVDHRQMDAAVMDDFFGAGNWVPASFSNEQVFDLEGLLGRLHSSSYAPAAGTPEYDLLNEAVGKLFAECQRHGRISFAYETKVYVGRAPLY